MSPPPDVIDVALPDALAVRLATLYSLANAPASLADLVAVARIAPPPCPADLLAPGPSPHRVVRGGDVRHVNCALDALILPVLEGAPATVVSIAPDSGEEISVEVGPDGALSEYSHPRAVVSLGLALAGDGSVQEVACPHINLFADLDAYRAWADRHPEVASIPLSLDQAVALVRAIAAAPSGPGEESSA